MLLTFSETVRTAINGFEANLFNKNIAIKMIEDAAQGQCSDCKERSVVDLKNCLMVLESAVNDEIENIYEQSLNPLDTITVYEAKSIYNTKNMQLPCKSGHIIGIFPETTNLKEIKCNEQNQEYRISKLGRN